MASLKNPAVAGDVQFDTFIYGAPPLAYPALLSQYVIYNTPDPAYVTGRVNISAFANLGSSTPWPFLNINVPLNGHVCVPRGRGPFPLAVFAHGNHSPLENSTPGYLYLCQLFASHGVIAATIAMLWVHKANHNQFNSIWASETAPGVAMPRASQEEVAKVHFGALAQALLLHRAEYVDVLRDHGAAV